MDLPEFTSYRTVFMFHDILQKTGNFEPSKQLGAVQAARKLLSRDRNPPINDLIEYDSLLYLFSLLFVCCFHRSYRVLLLLKYRSRVGCPWHFVEQISYPE